MSTTHGDPRSGVAWPGWCCSYCAAPLEPAAGGLVCRAEDRWFATEEGVHRLLPEERRRTIRPFVELHQRVRRDEGWTAVPGLPDVTPRHPHASVWRRRARHFRRALALAREHLGRGSWRVLEVGAGCCWASARLLAAGHRVAAVDVNLDRDDGLFAAARIVEPERLPRAEADMEAVPIEASSVDLVLAASSLHDAPRPDRVLVELRRVTRRGGVIVVFDSPVYRHLEDGEAMVSERMERHSARYRVDFGREGQSGYFLVDELPELFRTSGWSLEVHGWPGRAREALRDAVDRLRWSRRMARFPVLVGRRHE